MPSKKKKYNARFPAGRIKKIMQMDDDVGKIAHAVPVVISRSVELFINSLLNHTANITREKNAKTVSLSHTKHCILKEQKFDFLKDLVKNIADVGPEDEKRSSKNNPTSPVSSNSDHSLELEKSRKRISSDPLIESSSRSSKKRFSESDKNSGSSNPENFTSVTSQSSNLNSHSDNLSIKLESNSRFSETNNSCDLVIDEDRET